MTDAARSIDERLIRFASSAECTPFYHGEEEAYTTYSEQFFFNTAAVMPSRLYGIDMYAPVN